MEEMNIDDLTSSFEARERRMKKKKQEVLEKALHQDGRDDVCATQPRKRTRTQRLWKRWSFKLFKCRMLQLQKIRTLHKRLLRREESGRKCFSRGR